MVRRKKPTAAIEEAKKFTERMGYQWQENTRADMTYDIFIFKLQTACIVRVRQVRYRINPDMFYEELLKEDLRKIRARPFPSRFSRELWLRTRYERTWRRLRIYPTTVGEIDGWKPDEYTNPYSR